MEDTDNHHHKCSEYGISCTIKLYYVQGEKL